MLPERKTFFFDYCAKDRMTHCNISVTVKCRRDNKLTSSCMCTSSIRKYKCLSFKFCDVVFFKWIKSNYFRRSSTLFFLIPSWILFSDWIILKTTFSEIMLKPNYQHLWKFEQVCYLSFNRDLNRGCLVYMFSLRFSGSKFLINLRRQFRVAKIFHVRKIVHTQVFAGFAIFSFCV